MALSFQPLVTHPAIKDRPESGHYSYSTKIVKEEISVTLQPGHPLDCRPGLYGLAYKLHGHVASLRHWPIQGQIFVAKLRGVTCNFTVYTPSSFSMLDLEQMEVAIAGTLQTVMSFQEALAASEHLYFFASNHIFRVKPEWKRS